MPQIFLLAQATPETGSGATSMIRIVAGVLALAILVIVIVRRKKKTSKDEWS